MNRSGIAIRIAQALGGKPGGPRTFMGKCPCPLHGRGWGDRQPSLRIREGANGAIELECLAGCDPDAVHRHVEKIAARHRVFLPPQATGGKP